MTADRRRYQRVPLDLNGRYVLPDRSEHPCRAADVSPGGVRLLAENRPAPGQRVVVYLDEIGRLEGIARRASGEGFAMTITATSRAREQLTARLVWLANRDALDLDDDRSDCRYTLHHRPAEVRLESGEVVPAQIVDISSSGAAIRLSRRLEIGAWIVLDGRAGTVVRAIECGHGIAFNTPLTCGELEAIAAAG